MEEKRSRQGVHLIIMLSLATELQHYCLGHPVSVSVLLSYCLGHPVSVLLYYPTQAACHPPRGARARCYFARQDSGRCPENS